MPYIDEPQRTEIDGIVDPLIDLLNKTDSDEMCGRLNYAVSRVMWRLCGHDGHGVRRYGRMNAVAGAIESAKAEFQRRIVAPYEDEKIQSAGDIH